SALSPVPAPDAMRLARRSRERRAGHGNREFVALVDAPVAEAAVGDPELEHDFGVGPRFELDADTAAVPGFRPDPSHPFERRDFVVVEEPEVVFRPFAEP